MKGKEKFVPERGFIHIGFGHLLPAAKVDIILTPGSAPLKKLRDRAAAEARLVDATNGRRTRAIIITDSNHVILSALAPETLWRRAGRDAGATEAGPAVTFHAGGFVEAPHFLGELATWGKSTKGSRRGDPAGRPGDGP